MLNFLFLFWLQLLGLLSGYFRRHLHIFRRCNMPSAIDIGKMVIGTHSGAFHADELVACAMLKQLPEYHNAKIIRTRDMDRLAECTIVVDVGGLFDHAARRYDHHQREFNLTLNDFYPSTKWDIKLSSAGLIYAHYGHKVIAYIAGVQEVDPMVDVLFHKLYATFVVEIDAIDNGIPPTDSVPRYDLFDAKQFISRYAIHTGLSSRVSMMVPPWNKPDMDETECFMKALSMVETEFVDRVRHFAEIWYPARVMVAQALDTRRSVDPSGMIMVLKDHGCPWSSHVLELERAELESQSRSTEFSLSDPDTVKGRPVYCVYQRKDGSWSAQAIPLSESTHFANRLPFPEPWRGLRDDELSRVTGQSSCVFVHATGFLAIHRTFDGIMNLVRKSLKLAKLSDGLVDVAV
ncbi:Metal dependent protein hydrolase [Fasciola hepatica]|uniref:Metal dependent protein hydrolase n=1 Tax=Fasciola hepatica TaxID=6192 RepID=A0A4E0RIV0_FASHE|nr:Metal dependent protein hydrolase [Fasciola hepatica]